MQAPLDLLGAVCHARAFDPGAAERRFFATRSAGENAAVPTRFGYYAGWRIVRDLAREMTAADLLTLDIPTAQRLVRRASNLPEARPSG